MTVIPPHFSNAENPVHGRVTIDGRVAKVSVNPNSIVKFVRVGDELHVHLNDGKVVKVAGFFAGDDTQRLDLVLEHDGREWPVSAVKSTIAFDDQTSDEVLFTFLDEAVGPRGPFDDIGNAGLLGLLGAVALGAGAMGSGGGTGGAAESPAPEAPSLVTLANSDSTVTASGIAAAGSAVTVTFPDGSSRTVLSGPDGSYSATSLRAQPSGDVTAVAVGDSGKMSPPAQVDYLDEIAPATPEEIELRDDFGVTGLIVEDGVTDDARPTLSGNAEPGSTITIYDGSDVLGRVKADTSGKWTFTTPKLEDREHSITVTAMDQAGNESKPSQPYVFTVDTQAPEVAIVGVEATDGDGHVVAPIDNSGLTRDTTPRLTGTAEADAQIEIYDNGGLIGTTVADGNGDWSFELPELGDANHSLTARASDEAGNQSTSSEAWSFRVDTAPPSVPTIGRIEDDQGSLKGALGDGSSSDDRRPDISGSGVVAGDLVNVYRNGDLIGSVPAGDDGRWTFTPQDDLEDGEHEFTITATDPAGNESGQSTPHLIIVDTEGPDASIVPVILSVSDDVAPNNGLVLTGGSTNDTTPRLNGSGAEPNGFVRIYQSLNHVVTLLGTAQADAAGNWNYDVPPRGQDTYQFRAVAVDAAGNEGSSSSSFELTIDTTPPGAGAASITGALDDKPVDMGLILAGGVSNDSTPTLQGYADLDVVLVRIFDGAQYLGEAEVVGGAWSYTHESELIHGIHNFSVKAVDAAGNEALTSSPTFRLNIDLSAPNSPTISRIRDNEGLVQGSASNGQTSDDRRPELTGSGAEGGSIVKVYDNGEYLGETAANANGTWSFTPDDDLEERLYEFTVTSTDGAGNEGPHSEVYSLTIDISAPHPISIASIEGDVGGLVHDLVDGDYTNDRLPRLSGGGAEANSLVFIYDNNAKVGEAYADAAGNWSFLPLNSLGQGTHEFAVSSVDAAGNESPKSDPFAIVVDSLTPTRPVLGSIADNKGPITGGFRDGAIIDDPRPVIAGTGAEAGTVITIYDGGDYLGETVVQGDGSWSFIPTGDLLEGGHQIAISATDKAGNESSRSSALSFTLDLSDPDAPEFTGGYDAAKNLVGAFDDGAVINDARPKLSGAGAEAGAVVIIFNADGDQVGAVKADAGGLWTWRSPTDLVDDDYSYTAACVDAAGNQGAESVPFTFTVDCDAPGLVRITEIRDDVADVVIGAGAPTNNKTPTIQGDGGAEGETVRIYRNNGAYYGETTVRADGTWSVTAFDTLPDGTHRFTARAVDAAGNEGPLTDAYALKIDTQAPNAPTIGDVRDDQGLIKGTIATETTTDDTQPVLWGGGAEKGAIVSIYVEGRASPIGTTLANDNGTWSFEVPVSAGLSNGQTYAFHVTATDAAGNESSPSMPWTLTIDLTPPTAPTIEKIQDDASPGIGAVDDGSVTNDPTPTLSGTASDDTARVRIFRLDPDNGEELLGEVSVNLNGTWSFTPLALDDGTHSFIVRAVDAAGNLSPQSSPWTIVTSTIPPDKPRITDLIDNMPEVLGAVENNGTINDTTPTLQGDADADVTIRIYADGKLVGTTRSDALGFWSFEIPASEALKDGFNTLTASAINDFGFEGEASTPRLVNIDTRPPTGPSINSAADSMPGGGTAPAMESGSLTNDPRPVLTGKTEPYATVSLYRDGNILVGVSEADGAGFWSIQPETNLPDGLSSFTARATDAAGNEGPATPVAFTLMIDATTPGVPTIDRVVDDVASIVGGVLGNAIPTGLTNDATPRFEGTAERYATVTIFEGDRELGTTQADASGNWVFQVTTPLSHGDKEFRARATDEAGNSGAMTSVIHMMVDLVPPSIPIIAGMEGNAGTPVFIGHNGRTNDNTPQLVGTAEPGDTVQIYKVGTATPVGVVIADADGNWSFQLGEHGHNTTATYMVAATDLAGNRSVDSNAFTFTVDLAPPVAPSIDTAAVDGGPVAATVNLGSGATTNDTTPTLTGTAEADSLVTIYADYDGDGTAEVIGTTAASPSGTWTFTPPALALDGTTYTYSARATDDVGNVSPVSSNFVLSIDTTPPAKPTIDDVLDDVAGEIFGDTVINNGLTNDNRPTLSGKAEAGTTLYIYDSAQGANPVGTLTVPASGIWTWTPTTNLANEVHAFTVKSVDLGMNETTSDPWTITVDAQAPGAPTIVSVLDDVEGGIIGGNIVNNGWTNDTQPLFNGKAEAGSTLVITQDGIDVATVIVGADQVWTWTPPAELADGQYKFEFKAVDAAGNTGVSTPVYTVNVDTKPPVAPTLTDGGTISATNNSRPAISGFAEAGVSVNIYDNGVFQATVVASGTGAWTWVPTTPLAEIEHIFKAEAVDKAGLVSPFSDTWALTVDLLAPLAPSITSVSDDVDRFVGAIANNGWTNDTTPTIRGTGTPGDIIQIFSNGGTTPLGSTVVGSDGTWTYTPDRSLVLNNPTDSLKVTLTARAVDDAGNLSPLSNSTTIYIDNLAPAANNYLTSDYQSKAVYGEGTSAEFRGTLVSYANCVFELYEGDVLVASTTADSGGRWSLDIPALSENTWHSLNLVVVDSAGNIRDLSNYGYDTVSSSYGVTSNFYLFWGNDAPPQITSATTSQVVNSSTTKYWAIQDGGTAPGQTMISGAAPSNSQVKVYVDGLYVGVATASATGAWKYYLPATVAEGEHVVTATSVVAGVESVQSAPFSYIWDTQIPSPPLIEGVFDDLAPNIGLVEDGGRTNDATLIFKGKAEAFATIALYDNGSLLVSTIADADGNWVTNAVSVAANQSHEFTATQTDIGGHVSDRSAPYSVVVDTQPPAAPTINFAIDDVGSVTIDVAASGVTDDNKPTFVGTAEHNSIVRLYAGAILLGSAISDPVSGQWSIALVDTLPEGKHTLTATATDEAGNTSGPSVNFVLEIDRSPPPVPTIESVFDDADPIVGSIGRGDVTNDTMPTFSGRAEAGSTASIYDGVVLLGTALVSDLGEWTFTPAADKALGHGSHDITVKATDKAGNTGEASQIWTLDVDIKAPPKPVIGDVHDDLPATPGTIAPGSVTNDAKPTFSGTVAASEAGGTVTVFDGSGVLGTTIIQSDGQWTYTPAFPMTGDTHTITIQVTDLAGNTSLASDSWSFTIDPSASLFGMDSTPLDGDVEALSTLAAVEEDVRLSIDPIAETQGAVGLTSGLLGRLLDFAGSGGLEETPDNATADPAGNRASAMEQLRHLMPAENQAEIDLSGLLPPQEQPTTPSPVLSHLPHLPSFEEFHAQPVFDLTSSELERQTREMFS